MLVNLIVKKTITSKHMYGNLFLWRIISSSRVRYYSENSNKRLLEILATMPKANSSRISESQRQRMNLQRKGEKYGPSTVYLQVLGSGARGAPNSLYLFTDQKRYMFNCGECTQRLAHEHKVKLSKLEHIFITNKNWRNLGGLPGLSLTLQDIGVPNITLHGPEGLDELYNATKRFVTIKEMKVNKAPSNPSADFVDNVMTVKYVLLGPNDDIIDLQQSTKTPKPSEDPEDKIYEEFIHDNTNYYSGRERSQDRGRQKLDRSPKKQTTHHLTEDQQKRKSENILHVLQKKTRCTVAYICTLKARLGTLDLAKCVEQGVKPGPMLGLLKSGQDVILPNGRIVLSKDVKTPDDPGPVFIVLEVPDISYLKKSEFEAHFDNGVNPPENIPALVVHYTPTHVINLPAYRAFLSMFGPTTQHLIINEQNSCLGSEAVHRTQHKLHLLEPDMFPLLKDASVPTLWTHHPPSPKSPRMMQGLDELKNIIAKAQFQSIITASQCSNGDAVTSSMEDSSCTNEMITARTLTVFHLRPKIQLDRSSEPKLHISEYIQETMEMDGFSSSLDQFRNVIGALRYQRREDAREFPKVVFMGTGSCIPSKTRNTSAIVVHIDESRSMLLDCGEGTFGQLVRFYGPKRVNAMLRTLTAIYVSHLHADHHIGLIGVIQARRRAFEEVEKRNPDQAALHDPLYLLAPGQIMSWLTVYDQQFEKIRADFKLVPNQSLLTDADTPNTEMTPILASMGLREIKTCFVAHCPNAFGVALETGCGFKITYSGDTIPCDELVEIGQNSNLLIHEATMEDELADEARIKMHSTTSQAIEIGNKMAAKYTVLTHFSQRYARLPRLNTNMLSDNKNVGIAFDNMQITMSDLEILPHMYAPLQLMFAEHCVEMELKAANRARQKERRSSSPGIDRNPDWERVSNRRSKTPTTPPAFMPRARYRESNASRLRQESKGMTISGEVKSLRGKSTSLPSSPTERSVVSSPLPRNWHGPGAFGAAAIFQNVTKNGRQDRSSSFLPSRSQHSECTSLSTDKDALQCYVVDSRSKTLNTAFSSVAKFSNVDVRGAKSTRPHTANEDLKRTPSKPRTSVSSMKREVKPQISKTSRPHSANEPRDSAYGKPLVTPISKQPSIRREPIRNCLPPAPVFSRFQSPPKSLKVEPKLQSSTNLDKDGTEKATVKGILSGTRTTVNVPQPIMSPQTYNPMARTSPIAPTPSIANPRSRSKSPARQAVSFNREQSGDRKFSGNTKNVQQNIRIISSSPGPKTKPNRFKSPLRSMASTETGTELKKQMLKIDSQKKAIETLRSELIQNMNKNSKPMARQTAFPNTRNFKPQLEDIKSSYLLLNKKADAQNASSRSNEKKVHSFKSKPAPLNENARQACLMESRKKFTTRQFFNDSKYDKIEGLNWISW